MDEKRKTCDFLKNEEHSLLVFRDVKFNVKNFNLCREIPEKIRVSHQKPLYLENELASRSTNAIFFSRSGNIF